MQLFYCSLLGYMLGALNPAFLLAKCRGVDIRKKGSGNAGASNVLILFGKARGVICALLDMGKAYLAVLLSEMLFPDFPQAVAVAGTACVLGHTFPFYMKFKGGKGLACLGGLILRFDWRVFLIMLAAELGVALFTGYLCFVPTTASVIFPLLYALITRDFAGMLILFTVTGIVFLRHAENFKRIRSGAELQLRCLWKPHAEAARLQENHAVTQEQLDELLAGRTHQLTSSGEGEGARRP